MEELAIAYDGLQKSIYKVIREHNHDRSDSFVDLIDQMEQAEEVFSYELQQFLVEYIERDD